ncbi:hypothetical protein QFZ94_003079 [Paraburkholderia sp. JPY465]
MRAAAPTDAPCAATRQAISLPLASLSAFAPIICYNESQ